MKKKIEVTAKKVADAIAQGLKILQLSIDDVDVKIISSGGFFKKSVVELYYGQDIPEPIAQEKPEIKKEIKPEIKKDAKQEKQEIKQEKIAQNKKVEPSIKGVENQPANQIASQPKVQPNQPINQQKTQPTNQPISQQKTQKPPLAKKIKAPEAVDKTEKSGKHYRAHESSAPTDAQVLLATDYLSNVLKFMNVDCTIQSAVSDGLELNIVTENSKIIGYRGEVLDSLQYLTSLKVNDSSDKYVRVKLDGLDYRAKRKGILENLAVKLADKCVRTGKRVLVDSMDSMDRRIIHARLADREDVITKSEGKEPNRRVVIYLRENKQ